MSTKTFQYISFIVILFIVQYVFYSFELLLVISFFIGTILKNDRPFNVIIVCQTISLLLLLWVNGVELVVLEKFSKVLHLNEFLLVLIVYMISILSPAFSSYLGYTIREAVEKRKPI